MGGCVDGGMNEWLEGWMNKLCIFVAIHCIRCHLWHTTRKWNTEFCGVIYLRLILPFILTPYLCV